MDGCKLSGNTGNKDEDAGLNFIQSSVLNAWSFAMEWVMMMHCPSQWGRMKRELVKEILWWVSATDILIQKSL